MRCPDCKGKMDHCISCGEDYCTACDGIHECKVDENQDIEEDQEN